MAKRRQPTKKEAIAVLLEQGTVFCACDRASECCHVLRATDEIEWDHIHELAGGGKNEASNFRAVLKTCHDIITNGTKATTAGSTKHRLAKAKRIARGGKRKSGRKIPSRPFPKAKR